MKSMPRISDAEWQVMKVIWREGPCPATTVIESLAEARNWTPATIKTLLNRLVKKRALSFEKIGRGYLYSAAVTETDCRHVEAEDFIDRVFDGALSPFLAHFTGRGRKLRPEDIAELERILRESRRGP